MGHTKQTRCLFVCVRAREYVCLCVCMYAWACVCFRTLRVPAHVVSAARYTIHKHTPAHTHMGTDMNIQTHARIQRHQTSHTYTKRTYVTYIHTKTGVRAQQVCTHTHARTCNPTVPCLHSYKAGIQCPSADVSQAEHTNCTCAYTHTHTSSCT